MIPAGSVPAWKSSQKPAAEPSSRYCSVEGRVVVSDGDQRRCAKRNRIGTQRYCFSDISTRTNPPGSDQLHLTMNPELLQRPHRPLEQRRSWGYRHVR